MPLTASLIASIVAVEEAKRFGKLRWIFGKELILRDAQVLDERITAISKQTVDGLISIQESDRQLDALGLDADQRHALVARWAAMIRATPRRAVLINPITGQPETPH